MFPFTLQEFLEMIARYNTTFWPLPVLTYLLGAVAVILPLWKPAYTGKIVPAILGTFWLWVGIVFNGLWFSGLSLGALVFGVLFVVQGLLFAMLGIFQGKLTFTFRFDLYGLLGALAILYGTAGYPLVESLLGRGYPQALLLGLVPCPTTVFTLGMLLWSDRPLPKVVLALPVSYAVIGGVLVATQGVVEDLGMALVGLVALIAILYRDRQKVGDLSLSGTAAPAPHH